MNVEHVERSAEEWCNARGSHTLATLASQRRSLSLSMTRQALALYLTETVGASQRDIAEVLGRSPSAICRMRKEAVKRRDRGESVAAPDGMKWCPACSEFRRVELFYANRSRSDGLDCYCGPCKVSRMRSERRRRGMRSVPKGRETVQTNMSLTVETHGGLQTVADRFGVTMASVVEHALSGLLPQLLRVCVDCRERDADVDGRCGGCVSAAIRRSA